jgi:putative polyketide hydroxylase
MPYGGAGERFSADSPTTSADCPQEKLEPVLLEAARSSGIGEVHFGHELANLSQDDDCVISTIRNRSTGDEWTVRADWVIAADGAQSTVRSLLGIDMIGPGALFHRMAIYFRANLREVVGSRAAWMYFVAAPG